MNNLSLIKLSQRVLTPLMFLFLLLLPGLAKAQTGVRTADREMKQWRSFEPEGGGFRVSLPVQPNATVVSFETPTSTLDMKVFAARTTSSSYTVSYVDLDIPAKDLKALEAGFDKARGEVMSKFQNVNIYGERKFVSGKVLGREFVYENGANTYKTQMFLLKQRVYVLQLITPQMRNLPEALIKVYQAESDKFFNSFQMSGNKKTETASKGKTR